MLKLLILLAAAGAHAHGGHGGVHERADDESLSYAERHMASEHHIESFDLPSFFKLHDLDMDGYWSKDEIAAIYGLRHHSHQKNVAAQQSDPELENQIVAAVLKALDTDGDGRVSLEEFSKGGKDSLPTIGDFKHLGHHYDEESEYFLHHEELYHSTPETQTDESYTHPEDIEHFKHHAHIEEEEDARERKFEGLSENADLTDAHDAPHDPLDEHAHAAGDGPEAYAASGQGPDANAEPEVATGEGERVEQVHSGDRDAAAQARFRAERAARKQPPRRIQPQQGHKHRHSAEDRARPDAPYKYKMRGGLMADEF